MDMMQTMMEQRTQRQAASAAGPICAYCGTQAGNRLYTAEAGEHICECCFLDRLAPTPPVGDDFYASFAEALAEALDIREKQTGLHSRRAACHTLVLARRFIDAHEALRQIYWGGLLHDIGKIGIPDRILLKEGKLDAPDWEIMRTHVELGYRIVSKLPAMSDAADLVRAHEERFDGSGYPRGLKGTQIPLGARLFAIIDTLDAMTSDRPYRRGLPFEAAKTEIIRLAGSQFDPMAVEAFTAEESVMRAMVELKCSTPFSG